MIGELLLDVFQEAVCVTVDKDFQAKFVNLLKKILTAEFKSMEFFYWY